MIRYQKYQCTRKGKFEGKWYVRAVSDETINLEGLARHMAAHHTPYSQGCIHGVLKDMVGCIKELVLDGKKIKLGDLAIFSAGIKSKPAETAKDCGVANIDNVHLCARPTGELRSMILTREATKKQLRPYNPDEQTEGSDNS